MRVFVTGASGWIGAAVVPELLGAGHEVVGLARSDASADALRRAGAAVHLGSLDDLDGLATAAGAADAVIHLAFKHDLAFSGGFDRAAAADAAAIEAMGAAIAGSDRPLTIASGLVGLAVGRPSTEEDGRTPAQPGLSAPAAHRLANAQATLALAERGVRSSVVRLAPTVHGDGDTGFVATLVAIARERGVSGYIGDGDNRWPAVHVLDAARLFRRAIEEAPAGTALHAAAEEGIPMREIAAVIGRHLGVPISSIAPEEAAQHFAWLANFVGADLPASSMVTRRLLGWEPSHPDLLADLELGHYFRDPA